MPSGNIAIVMDGPSGQRLAERLMRSGLAARVLLPETLNQEAPAGQLYLAPLSMAADAAALARQGAHLCLIPPWPTEMVTIGTVSIGVAPVAQRGAVRFAARDVPGQADSLTPLKILYRERLVGALGTVLAESDRGEPLLATLPRTSNLHGYIMVTSLQLSIASAQTRFDDVARLLRWLLAWGAAHAEPVAPSQRAHADEAEPNNPGERFAPLVLLALASVTQGSDAANRASVRATFDRICQMLGAPGDSPAFELGWAWLEAQGVVSGVDGDVAHAHRETLERYITRWQLGPRLRRLRRVADAWEGEREGGA